MKIGILASTPHKNGYGRYGDKTYEKLKELGFNASDFNICDTDTAIYTAPQSESDELLLKEKELAEKAGIEISQIHGPWRYPPKDGTEEERAERFEKMCISIRAASVVGCKYWVIHPLMPFGTGDKGTENAPITRQINLDFFRELVKVAKKYGVIICLENMPMLNFSISTPEEILGLIEEINDDNLQMCLDVGHVNVFKELNLYEEVLRIKKRLRVLHVHDNMIARDLHLLPTFGNVDWKGFAKGLKEIGFNGSFSIETTPPENLPNDLFEDASKLLVKIIHNIID